MNLSNSVLFRFPFLKKWRQVDVLKYVTITRIFREESHVKMFVLFGLTQTKVFVRKSSGKHLDSFYLRKEGELPDCVMDAHIIKEELPIWDSENENDGKIINCSVQHREILEDTDNLLLNRECEQLPTL
jgi:hypothetical protein